MKDIGSQLNPLTPVNAVNECKQKAGDVSCVIVAARGSEGDMMAQPRLVAAWSPARAPKSFAVISSFRRGGELTKNVC
jgi:hypothetical protein